MCAERVCAQMQLRLLLLSCSSAAPSPTPALLLLLAMLSHRKALDTLNTDSTRRITSLSVSLSLLHSPIILLLTTLSMSVTAVSGAFVRSSIINLTTFAGLNAAMATGHVEERGWRKRNDERHEEGAAALPG